MDVESFCLYKMIIQNDDAENINFFITYYIISLFISTHGHGHGHGMMTLFLSSSVSVDDLHHCIKTNKLSTSLIFFWGNVPYKISHCVLFVCTGTVYVLVFSSFSSSSSLQFSDN